MMKIDKEDTIQGVVDKIIDEHNKLLNSLQKEFEHIHNVILSLNHRLERIEKAGERRIIL